MDYLKRFLTFNILSILGYGVLGMCIYTIISILNYKGYYPGMALILGSLMFFAYVAEFLMYFLLAFLGEVLILFILSKIFKKQVCLNIKNKVYDIMFRFGMFCVFLPIIIIGTFIFYIGLSVIVTFDTSGLAIITFFISIFDMEIKCIFFKKYFVKNS